MDGGCIDFDLGGAKRIKVREGTCKSSPIEIPWIALNILSFLQVPDVLSLGSCSKYLNGLFNSDEVWKERYMRRWRDLPKNNVNFKVPDELSLGNCSKDFIDAWKERYKRSFQYLPENNVNFKLKDLRKVLASCHVSDKEVCVSWGLCRTWEFDFYITEEEHYRTTHLGWIADNDVALLHMLKEQDYYKLYNVKVSPNVPSNE